VENPLNESHTNEQIKLKVESAEVLRNQSVETNGSGAPLEQKMIEGLFFSFPFLCGPCPEFILIY
jgi:hypothetical protein